MPLYPQNNFLKEIVLFHKMQGSLPSLILILIVLFASNASAKDDRKVKILLTSKFFGKVRTTSLLKCYAEIT